LQRTLNINLNLKNNKLQTFIRAYSLDGIDEGLLRQAFTHSSASKENNERLEFLGDAILDSALSEYLFLTLPDAQENYLTRLRSHLVNKHALAELGNELELFSYLSLGEGEKQTGGHKRASNLADAFEALLGAIFLSLGYQKVKDFILHIYTNKLQELPTETDLKDPKTCLQEYLQKQNLDLPEYKITNEIGKPHNKTFTVQASAGVFTESANGKSRKAAEQAVAKILLDKLIENAK